MGSSQGFWSYVHKDDEADHGRISQLAKDVVAQYEMITGETIELFLDKDSLKWGDGWRDKIDASLASVAFFIPVMTPRYFMSPECRRELQFFARKANQLGIKELILPLHYVDVPALTREHTVDDLVTLARAFLWEDWRELRYVAVASEDYRRAVSALAGRLVAANKQAEQAVIAEAALEVEVVAVEEGDDLPGVVDRMAGAEKALPDMPQTLLAIGREIEAVGKVLQEGTSEIKGVAGSQGFAHRLAVTRRVAKQLSEPTEKISTLGSAFTAQLHDVDDGFRAIIDQMAAEIIQRPESKPELCRFLNMVRNLSASAHNALGAAQQMIEAIAPIEKLSRDIRPVLRQLRQGLTIMVEARSVTDSWVSLIDATGVDCRDQEAE